MAKKKRDDDIKLSPTQLLVFVTKARAELYGKPYLYRGEKGGCAYLWCKFIDDKYEPLDRDEYKTLVEVMKKHLNLDELIERAVFFYGSWIGYEYNDNEAVDVLFSDWEKVWPQFMADLEQTFGCPIEIATQIFKSKEEEENWLPLYKK